MAKKGRQPPAAVAAVPSADSPDDQAAKDARTVFIRGVSFDADDKQLEELFSNVGPVKQCFLVRPKGATRHKGMGFVTYALAEDAERAIEELNGNNSLGGRKLLVELANKRAPLEERKKRKREAVDAPMEQDGDADTPDQDEPKQKTPKKSAPARPAADEPAAAAQAARQKPKAAAPAAAAPSAAERAAADKHRSMRTVALGGLVPELVGAAVQLARKAGNVVDVVNPAPQDTIDRAHLKADGCSGTTLLVVYQTPQEAMHAVTVLHGKHVSGKGAAGSKGKKGKKGKTGKQGADNGGSGSDSDGEDGASAMAADTAPCVLWARQLAGEGAHVRKWRVIIRNLPFKVSEPVLRKLVSQAGFVWELTIPKGPDGRVKGVAFAGYTLRAHAQKAVDTLNGTEVLKRPVAVDWALSKTQYEAGSKGGPGGAPAPHEDSDHEHSPTHSHDTDTHAGDASDDHDSPTDTNGGSDGADSGLGSEDESGLSDEGDASEGMSDDGGEEGISEDMEGSEEDAALGPGERRMLNNVLAGLLGDDEEMGPEHDAIAHHPPTTAHQPPATKPAKPADLKTAPAATSDAQQGKGALRAGQDGTTGQQGEKRGEAGVVQGGGGMSAVDRTVFVRGLPLDVSWVTLQTRMGNYGEVKSCRLVMDKTTGKPKGTAFVEYVTAGGAQKAADACARGRTNKGPGIVLDGKTLDVDLAVSQDQARQIAVSKAQANVKDRRNLYLSKEGDIKQGSAAWLGMSEHDRQKRLRAADEKRTKLRSPNFMISPTRLSVRNIPFSYTEAQLKALCVKAVKERASKEKPDIVQVKILKEEGKTGPNGKPRSKGLGFVEFREHSHAIACLRQLNNNPAAFTRDKRPIIEFAIENVKVLKKLEAIRARQTRAAAVAAEEGKPVLTPREKKKQKAKAKLERRKQRKAAAAAEAGGKAPAGNGTATADKDGEQPAVNGASKGRKQRQKRGKGKGDADGAEGAAGEQAAASKQQKRQRGAQADGAGKKAQGAEGSKDRRVQRPQKPAMQSKRRQEDDATDQMADQAFAEAYGSAAVGRKKRRKGDEEEDRLDILAKQYRQKLDGRSRPESGGPAKGRAGPGKGGKAAAGAGKAAGKGGAGKAAAEVAAVNFAGGNIRRWFDE